MPFQEVFYEYKQRLEFMKSTKMGLESVGFNHASMAILL